MLTKKRSFSAFFADIILLLKFQGAYKLLSCAFHSLLAMSIGFSLGAIAENGPAWCEIGFILFVLIIGISITAWNVKKLYFDLYRPIKTDINIILSKTIVKADTIRTSNISTIPWDPNFL